MRIPKTWIPIISNRILESLVSENLIEPDIEREKLLEEIQAIITDEMSVEDRLNEEVREILKKFDSEIERGRLDYRKLFDITKHKLVKERNLIL